MPKKTPVVPRNCELTAAMREAKKPVPKVWPRVPGRNFENRSYKKIRAKVTLPKLGAAATDEET